MADVQKLVFEQNSKRKDIYDFVSGPQARFKFVRLSKPSKKFLINQGAQWCLESFHEGEKVLFTGLMQLGGFKNTFFGDHYDSKRRKRSLICVYLAETELKMLYFNSFDKHTNEMRRVFLQQFLRSSIKEAPTTANAARAVSIRESKDSDSFTQSKTGS